ncbi:MAG: c-type cytochrome [Burkholderiales bacterium]|nr:c-type cytochrome [Burkholderiales bacterium]
MAAGVAAAAGAPSARAPDTIAARVAACDACHDAAGRASAEGYIPRIAGKPAAYLYNQLRHFRDGRRQSPAMTSLVAHQTDAYLREIAAHYAALALPHRPLPASRATPAVLARGRTLALDGDRARGIPACAACHDASLGGVAPDMPGLTGLPRDYINGQLGAWKNGTRRAAAPDCMAEIARALGPEDVAAVSAWLATQPAGPLAAPGPRPAPPLRCGTLAAP